MADQTTASLAAALLGLHKRDPLDIYNSFGRQQMAAGSSTAPLGSGNPLEGIARALQGGIGGLVQGYGLAQENDRNKNTVSFLGDLYNAKDDASRAALIQNYKGDVDVAAPIIAQLLGQKQQREALAAGANSFGGGGVPQASGPSVPLQPQSAGMPDPNNIGNVRPAGGGPSSGFQQVPDFNAGVNLAVNNVRAYPQAFNGGQPMTLLQIGERWAPKGDGANDPAQWARNVASISGLPLDQPIDISRPDVAAAFARGVHGAEKGAGAVRPVSDYAGALPQTGAPQAAPGVPGPISAPSPQAPAAPSVPPMPDLSPTPQERATVQQRYASGMYGQTPAEAGPKAQAALDAMVKERIGLQESRTKMGFEQQGGDYRAQRDQQLKQPQETIQNEQKARAEFDNLQPVKDYRKAATVFRSAANDYKTNTAAADLNLIYGFATMMDPGSVVREGEMTMVRGTSSIADQARGLIAQLEGKGRLSAEARANLMDQMASRYDSLKGVHDQLAEGIGNMAQRSGMNRENVVVPLSPVEYQRSGGGQRSGATDSSQPISPEEAAKLPAGTRFIGMDGKPRVRQ